MVFQQIAVAVTDRLRNAEKRASEPGFHREPGPTVPSFISEWGVWSGSTSCSDWAGTKLRAPEVGAVGVDDRAYVRGFPPPTPDEGPLLAGAFVRYRCAKSSHSISVKSSLRMVPETGAAGADIDQVIVPEALLAEEPAVFSPFKQAVGGPTAESSFSCNIKSSIIASLY